MSAQTYEKVYFHEDYKSAFAAFCGEYGKRAEEALKGRKIDHTPASNVDSVIFLDDNGSGGFTIGGAEDFVRYYERTYGEGKIERVRADLARAASKKSSKTENTSPRVQTNVNIGQVRFSKPRFTLLQGIFAMMLMLSLVLFAVSGTMLKKSHEEMLRAELEIAELEEVRADRQNALENKNKDAEIDRLAAEYGFVPKEELPVTYLDLDGEDAVEILDTDTSGTGYSALLDALATLFKS